MNSFKNTLRESLYLIAMMLCICGILFGSIGAFVALLAGILYIGHCFGICAMLASAFSVAVVSVFALVYFENK